MVSSLPYWPVCIIYNEDRLISMLTYTPFTPGSKHEANLEHTSCTCILNTFASRMLYVASSCKRGIIFNY